MCRLPIRPVRRNCRETSYCSALNPIFEDPAVKKVLHNAKFDLHILGRCGITLAGFEDTMLMSFALDSGTGDSLGLKDLALRHLGHQQTRYEDVVGKKHKKKFSEISLADATAYAAQDADVTLRLYKFLKPRLETDRVSLTYDLDRALVPVLIDMERTGVAIKHDTLKQISDECGKEMTKLQAEAHGIAGAAFNLGSPKQIAEILFEQLGLPGGKGRRRERTRSIVTHYKN